jgi:hypothetical protein
VKIFSAPLAAAALALGTVAVAATGTALTPSWGGSATESESALTAQDPNSEYSSEFTFVRIRFDVGLGQFGRGEPPWAHDYPRAERNFAKILDETTLISPYLEGGNIYTTDDPEMFRYPIAYMSEPGFWSPSQSEAEGLRTWLLKGGFLIFDDFGGPRDWYQLEESMRRVLPNHTIHPLELDHEIFDSFFRIESLEFEQGSPQVGGRGGGGRRGGGGPGYRGVPEYYGITENNEPNGRLLAVINYNNDIGDYWEWSDAGFLPIELTNEAYKLGVNYIVYAMTH